MAEKAKVDNRRITLILYSDSTNSITVKTYLTRLTLDASC